MIFRAEFDYFVNMKNLLSTLTVLVCLLMCGAEAENHMITLRKKKTVDSGQLARA